MGIETKYFSNSLQEKKRTKALLAENIDSVLIVRENEKESSKFGRNLGGDVGFKV